MKHLTLMLKHLHKEYDAHKEEIFNYTIPEAWDLFGYPNKISTKHKELIVNPYDFTLFTLTHIVSKPAVTLKQNNWYKESILYYQITRLTTAWDHDRSSSIEKNNLYHLNEQGTFLKAMLRLPFYQRLGINTILLSSPFQLGKGNLHEFANPNAIYSFNDLDATLKDSLVPNMTIAEQYLAFEECAHHLGMHIIWQVDFGTLARDNAYIKEHPEWFYWIKKEHVHEIHAPQISYVTKNCLPEKEIQELVEHSEDYQKQKTWYQKSPAKGKTLMEQEQLHACTTLPFLHDRINSTLPIEYEYTPLRFYKDKIDSNPFTLRCDIFAGKQKNNALWAMILDALKQLQKDFSIDGFYFTRPYLYPEELLHMLITQTKHKQQVVILEDNDTNLACDGVRGNSAYVAYDVWNHQLHHFAYRLKEQTIPCFAACEYTDTLRISQYQNYALTSLLQVLNLFLPNTVPMYMSGMECNDPQPLCLSYFQDASMKNALAESDVRYQMQPLLDSYYFEYRSDSMYRLPKVLEDVVWIRKKYLEAITNPQQCIPLWFSSPTDPGIGFAYLNSDTTLFVIANTDVEHEQSLRIQMDHVLSIQAFSFSKIQQIHSTNNPYVQDIEIQDNHRMTLLCKPGEVKFIEVS